MIHLLFALGLLLTVMAFPASAGNTPVIPPVKIEKDWIGWAVSDTQSKGAVAVSAPNASKTAALPGGGTAWAQAYLGWSALRMDAVASTGFDGARVSFDFVSRVVQVYRNSVAQGGSTREEGWRNPPSGSLSAQKSVYGYVGGATWQSNTAHIVTDFKAFQWTPNNSVSVTLAP